jgi:hypothetical protein
MAEKSLNLDEFIDANPEASYEEVMEEIIKYQEKMSMVDCKVRKSIDKKSKSNKKIDIDTYMKIKKEVRKEVVEEMEKNSFLPRILKTITTVSKTIKTIAKMMIYFISAIFNVDGVKELLKSETLGMMQQIYEKSLKIYKFI